MAVEQTISFAVSYTEVKQKLALLHIQTCIWLTTMHTRTHRVIILYTCCTRGTISLIHGTMSLLHITSEFIFCPPAKAPLFPSLLINISYISCLLYSSSQYSTPQSLIIHDVYIYRIVHLWFIISDDIHIFEV